MLSATVLNLDADKYCSADWACMLQARLSMRTLPVRTGVSLVLIIRNLRREFGPVAKVVFWKLLGRAGYGWIGMDMNGV